MALSSRKKMRFGTSKQFFRGAEDRLGDAACWPLEVWFETRYWVPLRLKGNHQLYWASVILYYLMGTYRERKEKFTQHTMSLGEGLQYVSR
ncbi:hypothetical protein GALMADRAFT_252757 [Galerina marginata CBS 339.88]|uniref:Uncharacterized protein n=1 Tax=Galerina marginata (strain CBS 339.88) TaxID=685588 RepID=A0A067SNU4_GALM3|nr:hypothetical protein GALMADRAFT_252757 [Galerina marginata CBS 339.88]